MFRSGDIVRAPWESDGGAGAAQGELYLAEVVRLEGPDQVRIHFLSEDGRETYKYRTLPASAVVVAGGGAGAAGAAGGADDGGESKSAGSKKAAGKSSRSKTKSAKSSKQYKDRGTGGGRRNVQQQQQQRQQQQRQGATAASTAVLRILEDARSELVRRANVQRLRFKTQAGSSVPGLMLREDFPIKELTDHWGGKACRDLAFHGATAVKATDYVLVSPGLKMADPASVKVTSLAVRFRDHRKQLPIEIILHTFLHELAHSVTVPEMQQSGQLDRKMKILQPGVAKRQDAKGRERGKKWVPVHHPRIFYANFATILRLADAAGIYVMPRSHRNLSPETLARFDTMINPNDKISVGTSPRYG